MTKKRNEVIIHKKQYRELLDEEKRHWRYVKLCINC